MNTFSKRNITCYSTNVTFDCYNFYMAQVLSMYWHVLTSIAKIRLIIKVSVSEKLKVTKSTLFRNRIIISINIYSFRNWCSIVEQHFDHKKTYQKLLFIEKIMSDSADNHHHIKLTIDNFKLKWNKLSNLSTHFFYFYSFWKHN